MATQVAGELYFEIDGQLLEIKRQLRQREGYPYDPEQLRIALQNAIEGRLPTVQKLSLLSVVATTNLVNTVGKKTGDCFTSPQYVYRNRDFDNWLSANQPNAPACAISTLALSSDWTFLEAAAGILGIGAGTDVLLLGKLLIKHGMTLTQVEKMVEATERGENTGMRTDDWNNFFFIENSDGSVSVGCVGRDDRGWYASVDRLVRDDRWRTGNRLLVRNLDASTL